MGGLQIVEALAVRAHPSQHGMVGPHRRPALGTAASRHFECRLDDLDGRLEIAAVIDEVSAEKRKRKAGMPGPAMAYEMESMLSDQNRMETVADQVGRSGQMRIELSPHLRRRFFAGRQLEQATANRAGEMTPELSLQEPSLEPTGEPWKVVAGRFEPLEAPANGELPFAPDRENLEPRRADAGDVQRILRADQEPFELCVGFFRSIAQRQASGQVDADCQRQGFGFAALDSRLVEGTQRGGKVALGAGESCRADRFFARLVIEARQIHGVVGASDEIEGGIEMLDDLEEPFRQLVFRGRPAQKSADLTSVIRHLVRLGTGEGGFFDAVMTTTKPASGSCEQPLVA